MKETPVSICERQFLLESLWEGKRLDGRGWLDSRELSVKFGNDWGSCEVTLGRTRVVAQVSAHMTEPRVARPNEGILIVNVELSSLAAPKFETGRLSDEGVEIDRIIERCLKESKCIDLESLCIISEEKVWTIRLDINVINHEGNIADASSVAGLAALSHFRRPDVTLIGDQLTVHPINEKDPIPLSVHHHPVTVTFAMFRFGESSDTLTVCDPSRLEEECMKGKLVLGLNAYREICTLHLAGQVIIDKPFVMKMASIAAEKARVIVEKVKEVLQKEEDARLKGSARGFAGGLNQQTIVSSSVPDVPFDISQFSTKDSPVINTVDKIREAEIVQSDGTGFVELLPPKVKPVGEAKKSDDVIEISSDVSSDADDNDVELVSEVTAEQVIASKIRENIVLSDSEEEETVTLNPDAIKTIMSMLYQTARLMTGQTPQLLRLTGPAGAKIQQRNLNLLEYQSKGLLQDYGVTVQKFRVATNGKEAESIPSSFPCEEYVIKAQVLAGGRGKGHFDNGFKGGVHLTKDPAKVPELCTAMIGHRLITKQTPKEGIPVSKVMVAEAIDITRETYFCILMDREHNGPVIVASPDGGVDIEEVAEKTPDRILKQPVNINVGVTDEVAAKIAKFLGFEGELMSQCAEQIQRLYKMFLDVDCVQLEVNPLAETPQGKVYTADAKLGFDDNASFRQKAIFDMEDTTESDPREVEASRHNLNYVQMDGNIGCLVNGAGLAMATMDIIKLYGGEPANFLDVGGNVQEDQVKEAFRIITEDDKVKAILVNVFGGIVNCATIANGIINACKSINLKVPLVVRLEGTNVDNAKKILADSGLPIASATDLDDAAKKAVSALD